MRRSSQQGRQHAFNRFSASCDLTGTKLNTKILRYCTSQDTQCSVFSASEQKAAAGGDVLAPWGGIHKWRKTEQRDWYTDW